MKTLSISQKEARQKAALSLLGTLIDVEPEVMESIAQAIMSQFELDKNYRRNFTSTGYQYIPIIPEHPEKYWWYQVSDKNGPYLDGTSTYISVCKRTGTVAQYETK